MIEFADLSAVDMLRAFRSRELSPVEVTEAVIQRIALWEPSLKALYAYDPNGARAAWMKSCAQTCRAAPRASRAK